MVQSNSNTTKQESVSEVQLSKLPLEQRWRYIEEDLVKCGLTDDDLDAYFSEHYTALYYLLKDSSAAAQFFRALQDLSKPILDERDDSFDGYPLYLVLLLSFMSRVEGGNNYEDVASYVKSNAATLQVLLPGFPNFSNLFNDKLFGRVISVLDEEEVMNMLRCMSKRVFDLLLRTEYTANNFSKQQAQDSFFENYNIADVMGALSLAQVDLKELLRRFSPFLSKSRATNKAKSQTSMAKEDGSESNAIDDDVADEYPEEIEQDELTQGEFDALKGGDPDYIEQDEKRDHCSQNFSQALFKMLDLQLKAAGLPVLNEEQRLQTFFYLMFRLAVFTNPVVCENSAELVEAQYRCGFEHLKLIDPKMFELERDFHPEKLFVYHDPHKLFGNCVYDKLNDFVMPLVFDENHPAYNDEFEIRQAVEDAIAKNKPCFKLEYRTPQPDHDVFEQYCLYIFSMESLGLHNFEYHGKIPFQGWQSVMCLRKTIATKYEVKKAFEETAENFKEVRARFFEAHTAALQAELDEDEEIDVVAVMNEYGLDNQSLGVILASKGFTPGFIRTQILDERHNNKPTYINGQYIVAPEGVFDSEATKYYLLSKPASFATLVDMLPFTTSKSVLYKFLMRCNSDRLRSMHKSYYSRDFKAFDQLRNAFQSQIRILHSRQNPDGELLPLRQIKDMLEHDVYYMLDTIVLFTMVFDFLVSHRRK